ncbi:MAG: GntR family transcriptional regulator [Victivallales bacterium]
MNKTIKKIYRSLLRDILLGKYRQGEVLPKELELAARFKTNRMNAQRAVNALAEHDIVVRKKRVGSRINPHLNHDKLEALLNETNRNVHVLYSMTPHWIHWNETSFEGLENVLETKGFSVNYSSIPSGSGRTEYKRLLDEISKAGASALVIFPDWGDIDFLCDNADLLLDFQMPTFLLNRSGAPASLDMVSFVSMDPFGDGVYIGALLQKNNFHNVLALTADTEMFWSRKRCEGIKMGLRRGQFETEPQIRQIAGTESGFEESVEIIKKSGGDITVVAINNEYAARLIDCCKKYGLHTPRDYKLIAFDDNPMYRSYELTSLRIPMKEIGEVFGQMICDDSWLKEHRGKISVKLNSKLIIRETLKPKII